MRALAPLPVLAAVLALAPAAWAPPPAEGLLVPGRSLGGIELGMTKAEVRAAWGDRFGVCRNCRRTTWYFNARPFEPQGAGIAFRGYTAKRASTGPTETVFYVHERKLWGFGLVRPGANPCL